MNSPPWWRRVPLVVWALVLPALLVGAHRLILGGGRRIPIVGAGVLAQLREQDAPDVARYALDVRAHEPPAQTRARIEAEISEWPDILVFGFDEVALQDPTRAKRDLQELAQAVENAAGVPVVVGFVGADGEFSRWFRERLCTAGRYRVCVEPGSDVAAAVAAGVRDGIARHDALRATTQVRR